MSCLGFLEQISIRKLTAVISSAVLLSGILFFCEPTSAQPTGRQSAVTPVVVSGPVQTSTEFRGFGGLLTKKSSDPEKIAPNNAAEDYRPQAEKTASAASAQAMPSGSVLTKKEIASRHTSDGIYDLLEFGISSVDYTEMTFEDVIFDLRRRLGINIVVYWPSLQQWGISKDATVNLKLQRVPAGKVVESLIDYVSAGQAVELGFEVDRGVLEINLKDELKQRREVRVYYIADLLHPRSEYGYGMGGGYGGGYGRSGGFGQRGSLGFGRSQSQPGAGLFDSGAGRRSSFQRY